MSRRPSAAARPRLALVALLGALAALLAAASACDDAPREYTDAERAVPGPVFLLGFDGLDPALVERWEREGLLPNFARLRAEGAVGNVRSTIPMVSPPAWTTVSTGTTPQEHGIWSFWSPYAGTPRGRYVDATQRLAPAIWQDLTGAGRTVGVVNVPITCPPDSVNGFMIAGFPYPEGAPLTWPAALESEITERGWVRDAFLGPPAPGQEEDWLAEKLRVARARREIALSLLFERRPDFSFVVFTTPDRIQHHLWRFHDPEHPRFRADAAPALRSAVRDIYVWCDDVLGDVMDRLDDDTTLMVLADHGFTSARQGISKNRLLAMLPEDVRATVTTGGSLFGGDFYQPDATEDQRAALVQLLRQASDGAGRRIVREVHQPTANAAHGWAGEIGPDVVAEEADGFLFVPGDAGGAVTGLLGERSFSGWHRRLGYFGMRGRPVLAGPVRDLDLADVPAMTMHLLGEPIPRRYIHNFPRRLFPLGYFLERPMTLSGEVIDGLRRPTAGPHLPANRDAIREQLRAIGYVD